MEVSTPVASTSSILCTTSIPSFDPVSRQLSSTSHHLISTPLSYTASFSPNYQCRLQRPPTIPYHTPATIIEASFDSVDPEPTPRPRKKRKKSALLPQDALPLDFHLLREKEQRRSKADRETQQHHFSIVDGLERAIEAIRDEWMEGRESWEEEQIGGIEWLDERSRQETGEVEWVKLGEMYVKELELKRSILEAAAEQQSCVNTGEGDDSQYTQSISKVFGTIITNTTAASAILRASIPAIPSPSPSPPPSLDSPVPPETDVSVSSSKSAIIPAKITIIQPSSSAFLLSDFSTWSSAESGIAELAEWDCVILDPPWPNSSADRSGSYETFDAYELWKLELPKLLGKKPVLVACWVTNKTKFRRLLLEKLFPSWGILESVSEWYWIKTTTSGEPVWNINSVHRRCYEGIVLGYYNPTKVDLPPLPKEKVFMSTPIGHSRKPVLLDLLRPYIPSLSHRAPNILELFARTSIRGPKAQGNQEKDGIWLSVGNEAVKFNVLDMSEEGDGNARGWLREVA